MHLILRTLAIQMQHAAVTAAAHPITLARVLSLAQCWALDGSTSELGVGWFTVSLPKKRASAGFRSAPRTPSSRVKDPQAGCDYGRRFQVSPQNLQQLRAVLLDWILV